MQTLILVPSHAKSGLELEVAADRHPTMDYDALATALRAVPGDSVDLLDYGAVDRDPRPLVRWVRQLAGHNVALALMGYLRRASVDAIFTNAESVALPLALLLKFASKRPRHVTIGHRLSAKKKRVFFQWLYAYRQMDTIFVYASTQRDYGHRVLGIPLGVLRLIPFHADHRFYRPLSNVQSRPEQICSAGLEWRDYLTLIDAVASRTNLRVRLAAASPWSKHSNETEARVLPAHVDARRYSYEALRELYAESGCVVVPLHENDFQAGVTTILEAMAMGKPVIATRTTGQTDVIVPNENGLYVAPGDVVGWQQAIARVRTDDVLRERLGRAARRWVEENATLDHWVQQVVAALHNRPVVPNVHTLAEPVRSEAPAQPERRVGESEG